MLFDLSILLKTIRELWKEHNNQTYGFHTACFGVLPVQTKTHTRSQNEQKKTMSENKERNLKKNHKKKKKRKKNVLK